MNVVTLEAPVGVEVLTAEGDGQGFDEAHRSMIKGVALLQDLVAEDLSPESIRHIRGLIGQFKVDLDYCEANVQVVEVFAT